MADNVHDKDIILTPPIRIPMQLALPPTLDEEIFKDRELENTMTTAGSSLVLDPGTIIDQVGQNGLVPPQNIRIVEQIVRFGPGGRQVVDVVIEGDPVDGAVDYEIRMANA